jgi:hypothetical protein
MQHDTADVRTNRDQSDERASVGDMVMTFPTDVLPGPAKRLVEEASVALSCPPDYIGVPVLAVLGAAVGEQRRLQVKEGWRESALLWTCVVGHPGSAKSPAQSFATEPLQRLQRRMLEDYKNAKRAARTAHAEEKKKKSAKDSPDRVQNGSESPEESAVLLQAYTTDTTIEALTAALDANTHGLILVRDEITGWMRSMGEYKKAGGADRPSWQSIWNGSSVVVNRKNLTEPIVIPRPFVGVTGGLPPDMLGEFSDEEGRDDGFIHRILFSYPNWAKPVWTNVGVSNETMNSYCSLFDQIWNLPIILRPEPVLFFTGAAAEVWADWILGHFAEMHQGPINLRGPWSKLTTYCARLALIIHIACVRANETESFDVDDESLRRAIRLIEYFKSHARKVYEELQSSQDEKRLKRAGEWIKGRDDQQASVRDIVTYRVAGCKKNEHAEALFKEMHAAGMGRIIFSTPERGGRSRMLFRLDC